MKTKIQDLEIKTLITPIGKIDVCYKENNIYRLKMSPEIAIPTQTKDTITSEIYDYFDGKSQKFNLSLKPEGTELQQKIWSAMCDIDYGHVLTYKELGLKLGLHQRVIGMACRTNPIPILIPCHRILSSNPAKENYSFLLGVETKKWLLQHEARKLFEKKIK